MIYITKQEGLYLNKVNSSLVSTCNCKMDYSWLYEDPSTQYIVEGVRLVQTSLFE